MEASDALVKRLREIIPGYSMVRIRQYIEVLTQNSLWFGELFDLVVGLARIAGNNFDKQLAMEACRILEASKSELANVCWSSWLANRNPDLECFLLAHRETKWWNTVHQRGPFLLNLKTQDLEIAKRFFGPYTFEFLVGVLKADPDHQLREKARQFFKTLPDDILKYKMFSLTDLKTSQFLSQLVTAYSEDEVLVSKLVLTLRRCSRNNDYPSFGVSIDRSIVDYACEEWFKTRNKVLEQLIIEDKWLCSKKNYYIYNNIEIRVFTGLKSGQVEALDLTDSLEVAALVEACSDNDTQIASLARAQLSQVPKKRADTLARLWAKKGLPALFETLVEKSYIPTKPLEVRLLVALKLGNSQVAVKTANKEEEALLYLAQACNFPDLAIAENARKLLPQLVTSENACALNRLVTEYDLPFLQEIVVEKGFVPTKPLDQALFYFLTDQWERYEGLDFDQRLLRKGYESANGKLRRRLVAKIRSLGRPQLLTVLTGSSSQTAFGEMSLDEAAVLVDTLAKVRDWDGLWKVVFELPLKWSVEAIRILAKAAWRPEGSEEKNLFRELSDLAKEEILTEPGQAQEVFPMALECFRVKEDRGVNDLAFPLPTRNSRLPQIRK